MPLLQVNLDKIAPKFAWYVLPSSVWRVHVGIILYCCVAFSILDVAFICHLGLVDLTLAFHHRTSHGVLCTRRDARKNIADVLVAMRENMTSDKVNKESANLGNTHY